jgi:putative ABC transport system permease protein
MLPIYLAYKEIIRNKFRFLAVAMVIALITLLVLFVAALGEGLATAGKQYIESIDGELIVFQDNVDISIPASRLDRSVLNSLARVPGVEDVGPIGFATGSLLLPDGEKLDVSLIGVEPGKPGSPAVIAGSPLLSRRANEIVLDRNVIARHNFQVGDMVQMQVTQGTQEKIYNLQVVGISEGAQYSFLPGTFLPLITWERVRPQAVVGQNPEQLTFNVAAVKVSDPANWEAMIPVMEAFVPNIEVTDPVTTYESSPGYSAQQGTIQTQQTFTLMIAVLVIGGFFQIQTLQKIGQIGMLKAIGASNVLVSITLIVQVTLITAIGILIGGFASWLFSLVLPVGIPIVFQGQAVVTAVITLLLIGPIGGLVSIFTLTKVEPLTALGLSG